MGLFGAMRTSVGGMSAQASRISSVAENISNTSTTGYKRSSTEFETLLNNYDEGGVQTRARHSVSEQGSLKTTSSVTDIAINGKGFFVVAKQNGGQFLTRAGSFVADASGNLVNTAGYKLMGYDILNGTGSIAVNGPSGLQAINISQRGLVANPSTLATLTANLPSSATAIPAVSLPSTNSATSQFSAKSSLVAYDNLGKKVNLDVYFSKTGTNSWEAAIFDGATAAASGGFPYGSAALATQTLNFNPANGTLLAASAAPVSLSIPGGATLQLDLGQTTQLAASYQVVNANVNGNAPSSLDHIEISNDGTLSSIYADGTRLSSYRIPLADVISPDNLTPLDGNVYSESLNSGSIRVGTAELGGMGKIVSNAVENSTVDLATELTDMIEAQRSYSANSKVFQAGSDLLAVLEQLRSN